MNIEKGMWVKSIFGYIYQVDEVKDDEIYCDDYIMCFSSEQIEKASFNKEDLM
jgi:hypothetical protein